MGEFILQEALLGIFVGVDNITICGGNKSEHDNNFNRFMKATKKHGLTLDSGICTFSTAVVRLLGYEIWKGIIRPDPQRFEDLIALPAPSDIRTQQIGACSPIILSGFHDFGRD